MPDDTRTIIFGAFDRHNFGDMLFAHIAAKECGDCNPVFAGIVARDLTPWGGHRVEALATLARDTVRTNLIVAGGEVLTCEAWQAAVMVLPEDEAKAAGVRYDTDVAGRAAFARSVLGTAQLAPYVPAKSMLANPGRLVYNAVGGVDFSQLDGAMKREVLEALKSADAVTVRDRVTQAALAAEGVEAELARDSAERVRELFDDTIQLHASHDEPALVRAKFPDGYLAVQFSADCGDDATLNDFAVRIDAAAHEQRCGVVLFRAGIAPWHDELEPYRRLASRLNAPVHVFESAHLWDICAVIARSRGYLGTSLHGWIVAGAYGLRRQMFLSQVVRKRVVVTKPHAYFAAWEVKRRICT